MVEQHLEQLAALAAGCEHLVERQVLVGLGAEGRLASLAEQRGERLARPGRAAQDQGVDEEADQPLGLQALAVGAGHADADLALPAVAMQQRLERRQQPHEDTRLMVQRGLADSPRQGFVDPQAVARGGRRLARRARMVGGQFQHRRRVAQAFPPVGQLAGALARVQPLPLPGGELGVVQFQRRQVGRLAAAGFGVEPREFVEQQVQRPTIGDDVMQGDPELVLLFVQAHQADPQQRPLFQVERLLRLGFAVLRGSRGAFVLGQRGEVDELPGELAPLVDTLQGRAVALEETRAQRFVAFDQALEAGAQRRFVQLAAQAQAAGDVVGGALRIDLPGQPETLLRRRLRQVDTARQVRHRCLGRQAGGQLAGHRGAEGLQGRRLEQLAQVEGDAETVAHLGDHLGGADGIAAKQEEVIARRYLRHAQPGLPDLADACQQFVVACRRLRLLHGLEAGKQRIAVQAAVFQAQAAGGTLQLAAGRLRQGAGIEQRHHLRRFLVGLGHRLADRVDQLLGRHRLLDAATDLGGDADAFLAIDRDREGRDPALARRRHLALDGALDVLRIEVVAADDEHVLQAPGDEQFAVAEETEVAGAQPGAPVTLDEGLRRGFRVAPVAVCDARPGGPDLADVVVAEDLAARRVDDQHGVFRLAAAAAHQHAAFAFSDAVARQRLAIHRQGGNALAALAAGDEQGRLGEAVAGEETGRVEAAGGEFLGEAFQAVLADRLGTGEGYPPAAQVETLQGRLGDPLAAQPVGEIGTAADGAAVLADGFQPAHRTFEEVARRHQHAGYAAEDRLQQAADQAHVVVQRQPADDHVVGTDAEASANQHLVGDQVAMADLHALGQCG